VELVVVSTQSIEHILKDCGGQIVIVENKQYLDKMIKLRDKINFKKIIIYSDEVVENDYDGLVLSVKIV
jgi:long-subunit acyl-CoA synthetase (AMP-forming)